jgi:hypothetical protein
VYSTGISRRIIHFSIHYLRFVAGIQRREAELVGIRIEREEEIGSRYNRIERKFLDVREARAHDLEVIFCRPLELVPLKMDGVLIDRAVRNRHDHDREIFGDVLGDNVIAAAEQQASGQERQ